MIQDCSTSVVFNEDGGNPGSLDQATYASLLTTDRLGRALVTAAELPSTQDFLMQSAQHLPQGVVCVADVQTKGRGRAGNQWTSPPGCLMFSLATRLEVDGRKIPFVQYVICLAVTEAVLRLTRERLEGAGEVLLSIKWPNDLYSADGLKVGGILCQSTFREGRFFLVAGVGLNVDNRNPTTCINQLMEQAAEEAGVRADPMHRSSVTILLSHARFF